MYHRMHELKKVLELHFSDIGIIIDYQTDTKKIAIWEPLSVHMEGIHDMLTMPTPKYGDLITIQLKFKPFT
jgi:hypothetical protein